MAENSGTDRKGVSQRKRGSQSSQSSDIDLPHLKAQKAEQKAEQKANTHLEHWCLLDVMTTKPHSLSRTGIICTIGMSIPIANIIKIQTYSLM